MRPILLYAPRGPVPETVLERLETIGAGVSIATTAGEAAALLESQPPDMIVVIPPARSTDAAALLPYVQRQRVPAPIFVLAEAGETAAPLALEVLSQDAWTRAMGDLTTGSGSAGSTVLLSRHRLASLLELWEKRDAPEVDVVKPALRSIMHALDASRVSLLRYSEGDVVASIAASSIGTRVVGRRIELDRYPELRKAGSQEGSVLIEEIDRDPLMDSASGYLSGVPIRSLICQRLPDGSDLYLHAVREREPFSLADVALVRAAARLLGRVLRPGRSEGDLEDLERREGRRLLETLERAFMDLPEPLGIFDASGRFLAVNRALVGLTGRVASELIGLTYETLLKKDSVREEGDETASQENAARHLIDSLTLAGLRVQITTPTGELIPAELLTIPLGEAGGREDAGWFIVLFRDLSRAVARRAREAALSRELKDTKQQLEQMEKATLQSAMFRSRFWAAASHELRTPLAIVRSHLDLVVNDLSPGIPEKSMGMLKTAAESLVRLERLIADILDGAVADDARALPKGQEVDMVRVLKDLYADSLPGATRRGIALSLDIHEPLPTVSGDAERIERILANLLDHSLRSVGKIDPAVFLSAALEEDRVVVRIADRGSNIGPLRAAHLFDGVESARGPGELSLAMARRLAEEMGAQISATANEDGNQKTVKWAVWRKAD
jgi:signal transduction histidine kinase